MIWSRLTTSAARQRFSELQNGGLFVPAELTPEYRRLREALLAALPAFGATPKQGVGAYDIDTGLRLYQLLRAEGFTVRAAADDGVWRHLSLCVIPDRVVQRWPEKPDQRFWRSRSRIWLRAVWWITHLAWQGNETNTRAALGTFTADMVVQLIERPGRHGFRVDLARALFLERSRHAVGEDGFRAMMKLNTARLMVVAPEFTDGGVAGYATRLREAVAGGRQPAALNHREEIDEFTQ